MPTDEELKQTVKEKYGKLARGSSTSCCCGSAFSEETVYSIMSDEYNSIEGHVPDADLGLGCGIPTEGGDIKPGMTVLDLGSGAGNDVFIAAKMTGSEGRVIGVDMTQEMIDKANANKAKLGAANVEFRLGEIENLPLDNDSVDFVISNCVLNLVPDKERAFNEIGRVTKKGGGFSISDIVYEGSMSPALKDIAVLYAGCIAGAIEKDAYLSLLKAAGFKDVRVVKEKVISIPDKISEGLRGRNPDIEAGLAGAKIFSITVKGTKE
jgi:SAM-dependent methyltransferase